jgi:hypothetical protein
MKQETLLELIIPAVAGALLTVLGFILKLILDYFYLRKPILRAEVAIQRDVVSAPKEGSRHYEFKTTITIKNYSKNDAYGVKIFSIKHGNPDLIIEDIPKNIKDMPVKDDNPLILKYNCSAELRIKSKNQFVDIEDRVNEMDRKLEMQLTYYNALGKKYTKTFKRVMKVVEGFELYAG